MLDELAAGALLGTDRRPPWAPAAPGPVGDALAALPWADHPEAAVLRAGAVAAVGLRASVPAAHLDEPPPTPPPLDDRPDCAPGVRMLIEQICASAPGDVDTLLEETFRRVAARGERLPAEWVPAVLDAGKLVDTTHFRAAAGPFVRWLAEQRTSWARLFEWEPPEGSVPQGWRSVPSPARASLVGRVRREDPAAGRALAEELWKATRAASAREGIVMAFGAGLGTDDEAWLEARLDEDPTSHATFQARRLLQKLPASAYRRRMESRLRSCVTWDGAAGRLRVALPDLDDDDDLGRDGLARLKPPEQLRLIVEEAGLPIWREIADERPERVIELIDGTPHYGEILSGLCRAAVGADIDWLVALAERVPSMIGWVARLDDERAASMLRGFDPKVISSLGHRWGPKVSRRVADLLAAHMTEQQHWLAFKLGSACHDSELVRADALIRPLSARFPMTTEPFIAFADIRFAIDRELPIT